MTKIKLFAKEIGKKAKKLGEKVKHLKGHIWERWVDKKTDHVYRTCTVCDKTELIPPEKPTIFENGGLTNDDWL